MGLNRVKLGDYIKLSDEKNTDLMFDVNDVKGVSIKKVFIETKADMTGVSLKPYFLVRPNYFCYVPVTSRNGNKITISLNMTNDTYIVSSSYIVFYVRDTNFIDPKYLFMIFNRSEFDRYSRFHSWGSAREVFSFEEMCDLVIDLPSIDIQKKYVAIYESLLSNLRCYESGLEDLKIVYEGYFDVLKKQDNKKRLGSFISEVSIKNEGSAITKVLGVNSTGEFGPTKANMFGIDISKYKVVKEGQFAYNPSRINLGSIAMLGEKECVISPMYIVFQVDNNDAINPVYLNIWLQRKEFLRSTFFYSIGSVRDTFDFDLMKKVELPVPSIETQQAIANVFESIKSRKKILSSLKNTLSSICPILIRGSILEAKGGGPDAN